MAHINNLARRAKETQFIPQQTHSQEACDVM